MRNMRDDLKALELIDQNISDPILKDKLLKLYISDIRREEYIQKKHDPRNISLDSNDVATRRALEHHLFNHESSMNDNIMNKFLYEELNTAIACLSQNEQEVIKLFFFCEMTCTEAAHHLGITQQAVSKTKKRALKKLKKKLF